MRALAHIAAFAIIVLVGYLLMTRGYLVPHPDAFAVPGADHDLHLPGLHDDGDDLGDPEDP